MPMRDYSDRVWQDFVVCGGVRLGSVRSMVFGAAAVRDKTRRCTWFGTKDAEGKIKEPDMKTKRAGVKTEGAGGC